MFHRGEPWTETVWARGNTAKRFGNSPKPTGWRRARSASISFEASRTKLKQLMERRLDKMRLCALLINATPFEGQQMLLR